MNDKTTPCKDPLNTVYIISKGRPNCTTAQTLEKIGFPGEWFIVCGNNDETLPEYRKKWGERVLVFDWHEEVKRSDLLDNFGVEKMGSGAVPVRNATRAISEARGEKRHWQFDDDYYGFLTKRMVNGKLKDSRLDGAGFYQRLTRLGRYADSAGLANIGFAVDAEAHPSSFFKAAKRVFNAHNLPSGESLFVRWRARMNDDLINGIETWRGGKAEMALKSMYISMRDTQAESGGNTEIYQAHGTVRKAAYAILIDPLNVKLVVKYGRYHHRVNWRGVCPKIIHERFAPPIMPEIQAQ